MSLSERIRSNCADARWVVEEVKRLEAVNESLKRELADTQNRCVDWASSKGTILAMYENSQAEVESLKRDRALLVDKVQGAMLKAFEYGGKDYRSCLNQEITDLLTAISESQATQWLTEHDIVLLTSILDNGCFASDVEERIAKLRAKDI